VTGTLPRDVSKSASTYNLGEGFEHGPQRTTISLQIVIQHFGRGGDKAGWKQAQAQTYKTRTSPGIIGKYPEPFTGVLSMTYL
jgi:hypothetical protein